jgi:hypothetical protein
MNPIAILRELQEHAYRFFHHEYNEQNGMHYDSSDSPSPQCIASAGMGLACYPVAVENHFISRHQAVQRALKTLRFLYDSEQSESATATGYRGFYYHFLDRETGKRTWKCELSSIDTTLLLAGILVCQKYFWHDVASERELRDLATQLYERVEWDWMCNDKNLIAMGWKPTSGFLQFYWQGYNEALLLYLLALGSPTHPIPPKNYAEWCSSYKWKKLYGYDFLYSGPLFIHQLSHCWVDFRGIRDEPMREHKSDYFENSRRATMVQRAYTKRNAAKWNGYCEYCWGISASDGPGPCVEKIKGRTHRFWSYRARGVPFGPDDGSLSPWAAVASLPFAPQEVLDAIHHFEKMDFRDADAYGYETTINMSYLESKNKYWVSRRHIGINQGPVILMIENHLTGLIWELMRDCEPLVRGLKLAGFKGGWLKNKQT